MFRRIKMAIAIAAAAGMGVGVMAQVPMQTTQDRAEGNRLVINGKPLFISGMNIAWNNFGSDLNNNSTVDDLAFTKYIQDVRKHGGNAVRWWLHNDASFCPKIDTDGKVTGLATKSIESMRKVLDIAYENGVVVAMCLFSHNLLVPGDKSTWSDFNVESNYKLLTVPENVDTYVEKGLRPVLNALGNHPAVMCWEVFNEPEGMIAQWGGMTKKITFDDVIMFTAKVAAEVHRNPNSKLKLVSTGIHEFNKTGYFPKYTDESLKAAAGGDELAYLDFYMAHWYPNFQGVTDKSPFANNAEHWGLGKPVIIGEFPGRSWGPGTSYTPYQQAAGAMTMVEAYKYAYENGYAGALSWAMTDRDFGSIEETGPGLKYLYDNHKSDIMIKEVDIVDPTGNLAMKLVFNALPTGDANEMLLEGLVKPDLQGKTKFTFDMYIDQQSGSSLEIHPAIQGNESTSWAWCGAAAISLSDYTNKKGEWVTVEVPLSSFSGLSSVGSNVHAVFLKFVTSGTPFTGTIYIDNIKIDNDVLADFDDNKPWNKKGPGGDNVATSIVPGPGGGSSVRHAGKAAFGRTPVVSVKGKVLNVTGAAGSDMQVRLVNMRGKTVARFKVSGSGQFALAKVPAGRYVVETKVAGKRVGSAAIIVR